MFDIFAKFLSSVASFLFPVFASYKALKTSDPTQLAPWLMYWVVLACALLIESWTDWFLVWIPFYAYLRLLFFLYLVLPQTQGARVIYETYVYPRLEENETAIEELIASAGARLRSAGFAELKRLIQWVTSALGLPSSPPSQAAAAAPPEHQTPQSYTQSLLARFTVPAARWGSAPPPTTTNPSGTTAGLTNDFYNFLASAVAAATTTSSTSTTTSTSKQAQPPSGLGSLLPDSLLSAPPATRSTFISAQRERLRAVLSALDHEEAALGQGQSQSEGAGGGGGKRRSLSEQSAASGLSKSRSEGDFEKVEVGSGEEEEEGDDEEGSLRRRGGGGGGGGAGQEAAAGGGWMPWGWGGGGGGGGEVGRSSGLEK